MFSNNETISNTQLKKMLIFDMISISIMILPGIAAAGAGKDGLIAIILGSLLAVVYSFFFLYASGKIKGEYIEFSKKTAGKFLTYIFGILYMIKLLFSCWFTLSLFSEIINNTLLPDTNIKIIIFSLIFVSIYAASKGIEVRSRITEVFFFIVMIPLIILFILGLKRVEFTNLFPLFTANSGDMINTSYFVLLTYSAVEMLMFTIPVHTAPEDKEKRFGSVIKAVIAAAVMNLIVFILVLGLLGLTGASQQLTSSITIMQLIQIPGGFVQRQDAIMLTVWMLSIFTVLSAYFYYLFKITSNFIRIKNKNGMLIIFGILFFLLSFIKIPVETIFHYFGKYMTYIGLPQSICIPLIIIIASKIKSGKGVTYGKSSGK